MSDLFNKCWRVTAWRESIPTTPWQFSTNRLGIGEQIEITEHRIRFSIQRNFKKHPNSCDIWVYNLDAATRADLATRPLKVQIEAGYDNDPRLLYIGDLRYGDSQRIGNRGETWETLLQLGDGDRSYRHSRVKRSYKAGTTYLTAIEAIAGSMGFALPSALLQDPELQRPYDGGTALTGWSRDELDRALAPFGYQWSIENNQLRILRDDEVHGLSAIPIDEEHGLIGSPRFGSPPKSGKAPKMTVSTLLYPALIPGDLTLLTSVEHTGYFRIEQVKHTGDSHAENNWTTECEILPR